MTQMLTYILFSETLDLLSCINQNSKAFLHISISHLKSSFLCIIRNILKLIQESMLYKFLVYQLKGQDCNNLLGIHPNQVFHTFIQLITGSELQFFIASY